MRRCLFNNVFFVGQSDLKLKQVLNRTCDKIREKSQLGQLFSPRPKVSQFKILFYRIKKGQFSEHIPSQVEDK